MDAAILFVVVLAAYFLPALVAEMRGHRQKTAIFVLNLLLGWTCIFWVVALVWAFVQPAAPQVVYVQQAPPAP